MNGVDLRRTARIALVQRTRVVSLDTHLAGAAHFLNTLNIPKVKSLFLTMLYLFGTAIAADLSELRGLQASWLNDKGNRGENHEQHTLCPSVRALGGASMEHLGLCKCTRCGSVHDAIRNR
jgi:hypothetical protein